MDNDIPTIQHHRPYHPTPFICLTSLCEKNADEMNLGHQPTDKNHLTYTIIYLDQRLTDRQQPTAEEQNRTQQRTSDKTTERADVISRPDDHLAVVIQMQMRNGYAAAKIQRRGLAYRQPCTPFDRRQLTIIHRRFRLHRSRAIFKDITITTRCRSTGTTVYAMQVYAQPDRNIIYISPAGRFMPTSVSTRQPFNGHHPTIYVHPDVRPPTSFIISSQRSPAGLASICNDRSRYIQA